MRGGRGDAAGVCGGPAEPDVGGADGEPGSQDGVGPGRVAAGAEPVLERGPGGGRQAEVRLSMDIREAAAARVVLASCESTEMVFYAEPTPGPQVDDALARYDDNGNGRISCAEARAHGIAPVERGDPAYGYMRDADGDGVVCGGVSELGRAFVRTTISWSKHWATILPGASALRKTRMLRL